MSKQPASPPPGDKPVNTAPPPPPGWRYWLWPVALLATIVLYIFLPAIHAQSPVNLNFSQFESRAAAHQIKTANIQNSANGSNTVATGDLKNGKTYTTVIPGQPTTALNNQLKADGLNPNYSAPSSGLGSILLSLAVLILPLLLIFWVFRRMAKAAGGGAGGLQGVLGVGRSRAKVFDAERPSTKFADVAGYEGAKSEIGEVVDFLRNPERYARAGAVAPRGVLMVGPPGHRQDPAGPGRGRRGRRCRSSRWPARASSSCSSASAPPGCATCSPRPASGRPRSSSSTRSTPSASAGPGPARSVSNDEREQTLNQLLSEMDGFDVTQGIVVLAATNRPEVLDPALLRPGRFDRQVTIPLPTLPERAAILAVHCQGQEARPRRRPERGRPRHARLLRRRPGQPGQRGRDLRGPGQPRGA